MSLQSKNTSLGYIEIREYTMWGETWYGLFVNNNLIEQSKDYNYILRRYNNC